MIGIMIPTMTASAAVTYDVKVGREFPESKGIPGFSARFYPESIRVHKGDTIHFRGAPGLFLPSGEDPTEWRLANAADLGDPYFPFDADPDDGADAVKFNIDLFSPTRDDCGDAAAPCEFDGKDVLSSGDVEGLGSKEFFVTITANPGDVLFAIPLFGIGAEFRIDVVAENEAASTQEELDLLAKDLKQQDLDRVGELHDEYSAKKIKETTDTGEVVWDAWAGVDEGPISLLAMYPHKLRIKRGQSVRWNFPLTNELHTATLPFAKAESLVFNNFVPWCDPDGDEGTVPDREPTKKEQENEACKAPAVTEFDLDRRERNTPRGDGIFTGNKDFEYSGLRGWDQGPDDFFDPTPWAVEFDKLSPDEGWRYFCTFHGKFMDGFVVVN
jgi:plastocyanin